jgi:5-methylcytosine-specific restriction endonuclease McrA
MPPPALSIASETRQDAPGAISWAKSARLKHRSGDRALEHLERTKLASAKRPRVPCALVTQSRHIPSAVKRAVWHRDAGRCAFVGAEGRCTEGGFLEFHHVVPYASGGAATEENINLRCRSHNQHQAEQVFGPRDRFVRERPLGVSLYFRSRAVHRERRALRLEAE